VLAVLATILLAAVLLAARVFTMLVRRRLDVADNEVDMLLSLVGIPFAVFTVSVYRARQNQGEYADGQKQAGKNSPEYKLSALSFMCHFFNPNLTAVISWTDVKCHLFRFQAARTLNPSQKMF
jgi:hypothetical protein